jgi:hypothetical protein
MAGDRCRLLTTNHPARRALATETVKPKIPKSALSRSSSSVQAMVVNANPIKDAYATIEKVMDPAMYLMCLQYRYWLVGWCGTSG